MGYSFLVVLLARVLFCFQLGLSKGSIVIYRNLGVSCQDLPVFGHDKRINLYHVAIFVEETVKEVLEYEDELGFVLGDSQVVGGLCNLVHVQSVLLVDVNLEDLLWRGMGHVLDTHASSWTVDEHWTPGLSIKGQTQVELLIDRYFLDDVDTVARET